MQLPGSNADMECQQSDTYDDQLEMNDLSRAAISKLYTDLHAELSQIFDPSLPGISKLSLEPQTSYDTFTCFPKLPYELRLAIWGKVANIPNVLVLCQEPYRTYGPVKVCEQTSRNRTPVTLRVCRESRNVTLEKYELVFGTHTFQNDSLPWPARLQGIPSNQNRLHNTFIRSLRVHFNKFVDTIYFSDANCDVHNALWECNDLPGLRSIALDVDTALKAEAKTLLDIFETHPINEVILVMRYDSWPLSYHRWPFLEPKGDLDFVELMDEKEKIEGEAAVRYMKEIYEKHMSRMPSYEMSPLGRTVAGSIMWGTQWYSDVFNIAPHPEASIEPAEIDDENVDGIVEEEATNHVKFKAMGVARGGVRF